jgi:amylosucrase
MVLLWSALAERNVRLLTYALQQMPGIPSGAAWLSYVRCHDDIGWAVRDEDAGAIGLNGFLHRAFLSDFYSGRFPGSFARGATFQYNERTKDRRISGSLASLAGLELALENGDSQQINLAIGRILLLNGLIMAFGGIPLLYMGDEIGLLNDASYLDNPALADDNRWLHRPHMDWSTALSRVDQQTVAGRIFAGVKAQLEARKGLSALHAEAETLAVWTHNDQVFGLLRYSPRGHLLVLANFTESEQSVPAYRLAELCFGEQLVDRLTGRMLDGRQDVRLATYEIVWLQRAAQG